MTKARGPRYLTSNVPMSSKQKTAAARKSRAAASKASEADRAVQAFRAARRKKSKGLFS